MHIFVNLKLTNSKKGIGYMREVLMELSSELLGVLDFIHVLRMKHGITPGPGAKGLSSDEMGRVGEFVYHELITTPNFTGAWLQLEDKRFLERIVAFVEGEIASLDKRGLTK